MNRMDEGSSHDEPTAAFVPEYERFAVCDGLHWLRSHESGGAAMIYFDPPYGHGTFGEGPGREWVEQVINEAWRVVADDGIVYLHGDPQLAWALEGANLPPLRGQIAWANGWVSGFKSRSTKFWPRQHQVILGFAKKDWRLRPVPRPAEEYRGVTRADSPNRRPNTTSFVYSDWWPDPNPVDQMSWSKEKVGYPTQKPLALMRRLIVGSTDPGDLVLDPSAGSGTTVVAALIEGRDGWGADISAEAAALAIDRLVA